MTSGFDLMGFVEDRGLRGFLADGLTVVSLVDKTGFAVVHLEKTGQV